MSKKVFYAQCENSKINLPFRFFIRHFCYLKHFDFVWNCQNCHFLPKGRKILKFPHCAISAVCLQNVLPIRSTFDLFSMKIHMVKLAHSIHMFIDTNYFFPHTNTIISRFTTCCMKSWETFALLKNKGKKINK